MEQRTPGTVSVPVPELKAACREICRRVGVDDDLATEWIEIALSRDARGDFGRGLTRLPGVIERVESGSWPRKLAIEVERPARLSARVWSTLGGWSDQVGRRAAALAAEIAEFEGIGAVACPNPSIAGELLRPIISGGQVGVALVQNPPMLGSGQGGPHYVGNNPIAVGAPGDPPFIFDGALSQWSVFTLSEEVRRTEVVPPDALIDSQGAPITDPQVALDLASGKYDSGSLAPLGGIKGWGLALSLEILAGALTGGFGAPPEGKRWGQGTLILALAPTLFGEHAALGQLQAYLDQLPSYPGRHHQNAVQTDVDATGELRLRRSVLEQVAALAEQHDVALDLGFD